MAGRAGLCKAVVLDRLVFPTDKLFHILYAHTLSFSDQPLRRKIYVTSVDFIAEINFSVVEELPLRLFLYLRTR